MTAIHVFYEIIRLDAVTLGMFNHSVVIEHVTFLNGRNKVDKA